MQSAAELVSSVQKSMQQLTTGKTQAGQTTLSTEPTLDQSEREQLTYVITQVFTVIKRFYPRTWGQGWQSEEQVRESQREMWKLLSKGLVPTVNGLERLKKMMIERGGDWPPSIPDIVKCLRPVPEDYGFHDTETAWIIATRNASCLERVPAAVRAGVDGFAWELMHAKADDADRKFKKRFVAAYEGAINRAMRGESLEPVAMIERTVSEPEPEITKHITQEQREEAKELLKQLRGVA